MPTTNWMSLRSVFFVTLALTGALPLSGCVLIGGYRSGGGFFFWPGSVGLLLVALLLFLMLRRRR